jgi:uncharacterized repeat protein (TIGR02543 family)
MMIYRDMTFIAMYTEDSGSRFTLTFLDIDGKTLRTLESVPEGTVVALNLPAAPYVTNHRFVRWDGYSDGMVVSGDHTLRAIYDSIGFTVTFDSGDGSDVGPQTTGADGKITRPEATTRWGYRFAGWFDDGNREWNFDTDTVNRDVTLTARWELNWLPWFIGGLLAGALLMIIYRIIRGRRNRS